MTLRLNGSTSGYVEIDAPAVAGDNTLTLPSTPNGSLVALDSSGSLGIGTSSPQSLLHLSGTVPEIRYTDTTGDEYRVGNNNGVFRVYNTTDTTTPFAITGAGLVGIGTTNPATSLEVNGTIFGYTSGSTTGRFLLRNSTTGSSTGGFDLKQVGVDTTLINTSNGFLSLGTNNLERARIDAAGRLLVGMFSAPGVALIQVQGYAGSNTGVGLLELKKGSTTPANGDELGRIDLSDSGSGRAVTIVGARDGGTWTSGSSHPGRLSFATTADGASTPTERMRIRSNGQTYWGSSAPGAASFGTSIGRSGLAGFVESYRNVNGTFAAVQFGGTAGYAQVMGDGDLENTNNRYTGLSDAKFKQNIEDATSQWDDIKSIQVRKYELIANPDRSHIGCVAQELELVCPGLVIERENLDGETYKSVAYSVLYMKAVKALQEAMERIETLETANASLEARLTALEGGN